MDTITYTDDRGVLGRTITVPAGKNYQLRRVPGDIVLIASITSVIPIAVAIIVFPDGTWQHWYTTYGQQNNPYWHFAENNLFPKDQDRPSFAPTPEQQATILKWYLHSDPRPFDMAGPGSPVAGWAMQGITLKDAADRYSGGKLPYFA